MNNIKNFRSWVEIDKKTLLNNLAIFQKILLPKTEIMAVVKANAYGHGLTQVAEIISRFKIQDSGFKRIWFGVDSIDEAIALREAGIKNKILILGWIPENRLKETIKYNLSFSLYNREILKKFSKKRFKIHLKIETGANRQGIVMNELSDFAEKLAKTNFLIEGLYSHLADSENPNSRFWQEQLTALNKAKEILAYNFIFPKYIHLAPTAAVLLYPKTHFNLVRVGLGLYGLWPSEKLKTKNYKLKTDLKPVLTWKTRIAQVKNVKKGETIGYGRTYKTKEDLKIAILPVGYYDGYDRGLSSQGEILIGGKRAKILGRVCMNMAMIDASAFKHLRIGDEAILLGGKGKNRISAEEMAEKLSTINYEVVARINPLIPRIAA